MIRNTIYCGIPCSRNAKKQGLPVLTILIIKTKINKSRPTKVELRDFVFAERLFASGKASKGAFSGCDRVTCFSGSLLIRMITKYCTYVTDDNIPYSLDNCHVK